MTFSLRHVSNGSPIGDGPRVVLFSDGGAKMAIMDRFTDRWSEVAIQGVPDPEDIIAAEDAHRTAMHPRVAPIGMNAHREFVKSEKMTLSETNSYLWDMLAVMMWTQDDEVAALLAAVPKMTRVEALTFSALWGAQGRILTHNALADRIGLYLASRPHDEAAKTWIKRLRIRIAEAQWPVEIITHYGFGFQMISTDPEWRPPGPEDQPRPSWTRNTTQGD